VKIVIQNIVVALVGLFALLFIDYMFVKSGQDHSSIWYSSWVNYLAFAIVPVGFYVVNYFALSHKAAITKYSLSLVISGLLTGIWFLVAFTVVGNFHLYMGGTL
jgi:integral membrane sensor domain MASE1